MSFIIRFRFFVWIFPFNSVIKHVNAAFSGLKMTHLYHMSVILSLRNGLDLFDQTILREFAKKL